MMYIKGSGKPCLVLEQQSGAESAYLTVERSKNGLIAKMNMMPSSFYEFLPASNNMEFLKFGGIKMIRDIDYLAACSEAAYDVFLNLDRFEYTEEYTFAYDTYTNLLLICCCFKLKDAGQNDASDEIIEKRHRYFKPSMPLSFTTWAYQVYQDYQAYKNTDYKEHDELDNVCRKEYGRKIASYLFTQYAKSKQYKRIIPMLFGTVVGMMDRLEQDIADHKKNETAEVKCMNLDDVSQFIPSIWATDREGLWYRKMWEILTKQGLTSYTTAEEQDKIIIRAAALGMIYIDLCQKIADQEASYDEIVEGVRDYLGGEEEVSFFYGRNTASESYPGLGDAIGELTDRERSLILTALSHEMSDEMICVSAYATTTDVWNETDYDYEDGDESESDEKPVDINDYDTFWAAIDEKFVEICDWALDELLPGYAWLSEGAERLGYLSYWD